MPDTTTANPFVPARGVKDRHAMVIALESPPNGGKSYSALCLGTGAAEAQGKRVAVIDTEGGRMLHPTLRENFDFDYFPIEPPHRPEKYLEAAQIAAAHGYGAIVIDSFSNVWRGIGGVLHWADEEMEAIIDRQRSQAAQYNRDFNEAWARDKNKANSLIRPKMAFKFMMAGLLDIKVPIILSIRGEITYDPGDKKEIFKVHMNRDIGFDVTVRFRLAPDKKGFIDISDSAKFKMEGDHARIFRNGEQIRKEHGAALEAWARNGDFALIGDRKAVAPEPTTTDKPYRWAAANGNVRGWDTAAEWAEAIGKAVAGWQDGQLQPALDRNIAEIRSHMKVLDDADFEHASAILRAFGDRGVRPASVALAAADQGGTDL